MILPACLPACKLATDTSVPASFVVRTCLKKNLEFARLVDAETYREIPLLLAVSFERL